MGEPPKKLEDLRPEDTYAMCLAEFRYRYGFTPVDALEKWAFANSCKRFFPSAREALEEALPGLDLSHVNMEEGAVPNPPPDGHLNRATVHAVVAATLKDTIDSHMTKMLEGIKERLKVTLPKKVMAVGSPRPRNLTECRTRLSVWDKRAGNPDPHVGVGVVWPLKAAIQTASDYVGTLEDTPLMFNRTTTGGIVMDFADGMLIHILPNGLLTGGIPPN